MSGITGMAAANAAPITATDSLSQALKANIIPNQEYLLQVTVFEMAIYYLNINFYYRIVIRVFLGLGA